MASTIGTNHGIEATRKKLQEMDPGADFAGFDRLFGDPGKVYPSQSAPVEGTVSKLVMGHNEVHRQGGWVDVIRDLKGKVDALPFPFAAP